jgi:hypothetical protein
VVRARERGWREVGSSTVHADNPSLWPFARQRYQPCLGSSVIVGSLPGRRPSGLRPRPVQRSAGPCLRRTSRCASRIRARSTRLAGSVRDSGEFRPLAFPSAPLGFGGSRAEVPVFKGSPSLVATPPGLEPGTFSLEARHPWDTYRCVLNDLRGPETELCGALCGLCDPAAAVPGVGCCCAAAILSNSSRRRRRPSLRRSIASRCSLVSASR